MATRGLLGHYGGLLQSQTDDRRLRLALEEQRRLREQDRAQMVAQAMQALAGAPAGALQAYAGLKQQEMDNKLRAAQLKNAQAQAESYAKQTETAAARDAREAEAFRLKQMREADAAAAKSHLATLKPELREDLPSYLRNMQSLMREEHGPGPMAPSQATPVSINLPGEYPGRLMEASQVSKKAEADIAGSVARAEKVYGDLGRKAAAEERRMDTVKQKSLERAAADLGKYYASNGSVAALVTNLNSRDITEEDANLFDEKVAEYIDSAFFQLRAMPELEGVSDDLILVKATGAISDGMNGKAAALFERNVKNRRAEYQQRLADIKAADIALKRAAEERKRANASLKADAPKAFKNLPSQTKADMAKFSGATRSLIILRDAANQAEARFTLLPGMASKAQAALGSVFSQADPGGKQGGLRSRIQTNAKLIHQSLNVGVLSESEAKFWNDIANGEFGKYSYGQYQQMLYSLAKTVHEYQRGALAAGAPIGGYTTEELEEAYTASGAMLGDVEAAFGVTDGGELSAPSGKNEDLRR